MSEDLQEVEEPVDEAPDATPEPVDEAPVADSDAEAVKQVEDRNEKCEPIASEIIQIIARHAPSTKTLSHEEYLKEFTPIFKDVIALFLDKEVTMSEANFTWSIVQSVLDQAKQISSDTVQVSFETAQRKLFDVESVSDLTLKKLDDILTAEKK